MPCCTYSTDCTVKEFASAVTADRTGAGPILAKLGKLGVVGKAPWGTIGGGLFDTILLPSTLCE